MKWLLALALAASACGNKDKPATGSGSGSAAAPSDAAVAATDWVTTCEIALRAAPKATPNRRAKSIIDGCHVCNGLDWKPILDWSTPPPEGPTRISIETLMTACGYCDANGKQRFLGSLDAARGTASRAPWRFYGDMCKEQASAVPDGRFMSAPYFALDKIARAATANPKLAPLLDGIEIALPPSSITGIGLSLPEARVMQPRVGPVQVTVTTAGIRIGYLPRAKLTKDGVAVDHGGEPYPGTLVDKAKLDDEVGKLLAAAKPNADAEAKLPTDGAIAIFAPGEMLAADVVPIIAILAKRRVVMAVRASGGPTGWELAGSVPVLLDTTVDPKGTVLQVGESFATLVATVKDMVFVGKPTIQVDPKTTSVNSLAGAIGVASFKGASGAAIVVKAPTKSP